MKNKCYDYAEEIERSRHDYIEDKFSNDEASNQSNIRSDHKQSFIKAYISPNTMVKPKNVENNACQDAPERHDLNIRLQIIIRNITYRSIEAHEQRKEE